VVVKLIHMDTTDMVKLLHAFFHLIVLPVVNFFKSQYYAVMVIGS
jgi:hypothetical protein